MKPFGKAVAVFLAAAALCLALAPAPGASEASGGFPPDAIGVSYWSHSPSGSYTMEARHYLDGSLWMSFAGSSGAGEIGNVVSVKVLRGSETGPQVAGIYPVRMDSMMSVSLGTVLPEGEYVVRVDNSSGSEVVCCGLKSGGNCTLTFEASAGGTVSDGTVAAESFARTVPAGSVMSLSGDIVVVSFEWSTGDVRELFRASASPPSGKLFDGWWTDGSKMSSDVTVSSDTVVSAVWKDREVPPSPDPPGPDPPSPDPPDPDPPGPGPDPVPPDNGWKAWIPAISLGLLVLSMMSMVVLFIPRRFEVVLIAEGGAFASVPEKWERKSEDSISRRYCWFARLEVPPLDVVPPAGKEGMTIVGWVPELPAKVDQSIEARCIWSDGAPERIGSADDRE